MRRQGSASWMRAWPSSARFARALACALDPAAGPCGGSSSSHHWSGTARTGLSNALRGGRPSPRGQTTSPSRKCRDPRSRRGPRRSCPAGYRPRNRCSRAGGPRRGLPGDSSWGRPGCPSAPPTTRAPRRVRDGNPSAGAERGAPGPQTEAPGSPCGGPERQVQVSS